jgi:ankyrin repeat protein
MDVLWVSGRRARLVGLVGRPKLNGVEVILLKTIVNKGGRWAAHCVVSGEKLLVKASNLEPSAALLDTLSTDDVSNILFHLPAPKLLVISCVCHALLESAKFVARSAAWQLRHMSLLELVQGGADPEVIRAKHYCLVRSRMGKDAMREDAVRTLRSQELMEAARFLVRSGAPAMSLQAVWELPPEYANLTSSYLYDLCASFSIGNEEEPNEDDDEELDNDGMTLLHHGAMCGAGPEVMSMILNANPDTEFVADHNGFLPIHHAAMRGSSTRVMRMLLQRVDPVDVYESAGDCGTLLHLALQGGSSGLGGQSEPPLSASQDAVAMLLLQELGTLVPPPEDWPDFVPPAGEALMGPAWAPPERFPLHLAAIAGAAPPLLAALLAEFPLAVTLRDAKPRSPELIQPFGYLAAHYALGVARTGPYSSNRACSPEAQATVLAAYPLEAWPLIDLIRAGASALADCTIESLVLRQIANLEGEECTAWYLPDGGKVESDLLLHLALAHAAPLPVLTALLRRRPTHASTLAGGRVRLHPLHLAQTAAAVELLLTYEPSGAVQASMGKEPSCDPLTYALRNRAPEAVVHALRRSSKEEGRRQSGGVDAFGNETRALGQTHPQLRKASSRDMRKLWAGLTRREKGLRHLLGGDHAGEEGASPLLHAIVEEVDDETVEMLLLEPGVDVSRGTRQWGCDCPDAGGCGRCVGRRLPGGWTPLHEACCQGRADLVRLLLDAGADATCVTSVHRAGGGTTPLEVALDQEHRECVELLQRHLGHDHEGGPEMEEVAV